MFKLFIVSLLALPIQNLRIAPEDIGFNNDLNNILMSIGTIGYFMPKFLRNNEICKNDDDCPLIMRCCEVGLQRFCCTPNNYIKLKPAFIKETIKEK